MLHGAHSLRCGVRKVTDRCGDLGSFHGKHVLEHAVVCFKKPAEGHAFVRICKRIGVRRRAELDAFPIAVGDGGTVAQLGDERAVCVAEESVGIGEGKVESDGISERHLHDRAGAAGVFHGRCGKDIALFVHPVKGVHQGDKRLLHGQRAAVSRAEPDRAVSRTLEFGRKNRVLRARRHGERAKRRRNVELLKRSAHRILSADRRDSEVVLRVERAEQSGKGLAPSALVRAGLFKVLLEGEVDVLERSARRDKLCHGFYHREVCAVVRAFLRDERIEAPRHKGRALCPSLSGEYPVHHRLGRSYLILSAEGHENGRCADRGIKALCKPALRA